MTDELKPQQVVIQSGDLMATYKYVPTPYKLMRSKAWWLPRFLWWALGKLNALEPWLETVETWTFVPHEQREISEAVMAAVSRVHMMRRVRDGDHVIVMGAKNFAELAQSPMFRDHMTFAAGPFSSQDPYHGRQAFGLKIHVVPNIEGIAVLPRAIIEKEVSPRGVVNIGDRPSQSKAFAAQMDLAQRLRDEDDSF